MNVYTRITCCAIILGAAACGGVRSFAQAAGQSTIPKQDPSVVTVDVIAQNTKTTAILPKLDEEDFRVLDNGHEAPIVSFGSGGHYTVSPIALWLVLSCNSFAPPDFASGFMRGKTQYLRPALNGLDKADTVGVAHWCGDGSAAVDLPPGHDPDAAIAVLDEILKRKSVEGANRQGQMAMQKMVDMVLDNTRKTEPHRLPVFVFLYGDAGFAFVSESDGMLHSLLSTPSIVYGLNDAGYHFDPSAMFGSGEIYFQIHYLSQQTGGQVYGTPDSKMLTKALGYILLQLHFRYALGFKPENFDGKKHDLKVELTPGGQRKYADALLRYRSQYIPVAAR
jgi:hypothetical protein